MLASEPEKCYHSHLMLYYPWPDEEELNGHYLTYEALYNEFKDVIDQNAEQFKQQILLTYQWKLSMKILFLKWHGALIMSTM